MIVTDSGLLSGPGSVLEDLGSPKLDELFYSDSMADYMKNDKTKQRWLQQAYGDIVSRSQPKTYLLKLVEYNKIAIC